MRKFYKIISVTLAFALFLSLACVQFSAATIFERDGFQYSYASATTADLHGRTTEDANLVIPKEFSEHYIVNIVDSAFEDDQNIESLSFSKAYLLERIGFYAFHNCKNLSGTVYFTGRISNLGVSAFQGCSSLEGVVFNSYISNISDQSFYNCSSLNNVKLNSNVKNIGKFAFANCTSLEYVEIPKSVTAINATAFDGDENLVLGVYKDSYALQYAEDNKIDHIILDGDKTGDVNGDGVVDILDATEIQKYAAESTDFTDEQFELGDINKDGYCDVIDALLVQKSVIGAYEIPQNIIRY